jgi:hypothetical protein
MVVVVALGIVVVWGIGVEGAMGHHWIWEWPGLMFESSLRKPRAGSSLRSITSGDNLNHPTDVTDFHKLSICTFAVNHKIIQSPFGV